MKRAPNAQTQIAYFSVLRGVQFLGIHATLVDTKPELVGPNVTENVKEGRSYSAEDVATGHVCPRALLSRLAEILRKPRLSDLTGG